MRKHDIIIEQSPIKQTTEQVGPNGWMAFMISTGVIAAVILVAVVAFQIAIPLGYGAGIYLTALGLGEGSRRFFIGAAEFSERRARGHAEIMRAEQPKQLPCREDST